MKNLQRLWRDERSAVPFGPATIASAGAAALLGVAVILLLSSAQHYRHAEHWMRIAEAAQTTPWAAVAQAQPA